MKVNHKIKTGILLGGALTFNILFWKEDLGINSLLFSLIIIILGALFAQGQKLSKQAIISAVGVMISAGFVVYHNSFMAKFVNITSVIMYLGFVNQFKLKQVFHAIPTSVANLGMVPSVIFSSDNEKKERSSTNKKFGRTLKLTVIPALFFAVFYIIFYNSNPTFQAYSDRMWDEVFFWLENIFEHFSFAWILLYALGIMITGWAVFRSDIKHFLKLEEKLSPDISRAKIKASRNRAYMFKNLDLKNEYRSALYMIVSINALLLVVNVIDIRWNWFNFEYEPTMNLSRFVHEGTYLLILSILLSMGILLYFFRKNLNFYTKNKRLSVFASIWIFQNLILVISVAIRNYQYIHHYGLAYKRIGVFVFLAATLVGLVTLLIKITNKKSAYYLVGSNSWSVYALLLIMSSVNWDMVIVKHNVNHPNTENIDVKFLLSLSDKTLPVIDANREKLKIDDHKSFWRPREYSYVLDTRIANFKKRKEETSWKSWNYAEDKAYKELTDKE